MTTSYQQEILKIHCSDKGTMENLSYQEAWNLIELIQNAEKALKRAEEAGNPPSPYDFTKKELDLLDRAWYFCCNYLQKTKHHISTKYGVPDKQFKWTKKTEKALLDATKEAALADGTIRPTEIKLSQIIDHPQLKKIVQLAESSDNTPSISITIPGFTIQALKGKKIIASNADQLQIHDPPTEFTIKINQLTMENLNAN